MTQLMKLLSKATREAHTCVWSLLGPAGVLTSGAHSGGTQSDARGSILYVLACWLRECHIAVAAFVAAPTHVPSVCATRACSMRC
jgi:hypothetical protein